MDTSTSAIGSVMLIDDSKVDNFINSKILELSERTNKIQIFEDANLALGYLEESTDHPDVIFLDIYMPYMTGFDFLEEFDKLPTVNKKATKIILLSSAYNTVEVEKLKKFTWLSGYIVKPLTYEALDSVFL